MFKFGRFKTSFNIYDGKNSKGKKHDGINDAVSITGAYRTTRDELFIYSNNPESQRKITPAAGPAPSAPSTRPAPSAPSTPLAKPAPSAPLAKPAPSAPLAKPAPSAPPAPVPPVPPPIPLEPQPGVLRQTKSTSDLIKDKNLPSALRPAQSGISLDPRGTDNENKDQRSQPVDLKKNHRQLDAQKRVEKQRLAEQKKLEKQRLEEQKKLEKQRLEEQKKREKQALQERAKEEKLRKEREKREAQLKKGKRVKKAAPQKPLVNPLAQSSTQTANDPRGQTSRAQYSTNTLESSISKTSGPPPYSEVPDRDGSENGTNSNVTYSKPVDTGSWDMISQHRNNISNSKTTSQPAKGKVTTMDLHYTLGQDTNRDNSEA